jgi:hypothetical protein
MQSRSYENSNGQKVFVTELVVNEMHFTGSNNASDGQQSQVDQILPTSNKDRQHPKKTLLQTVKAQWILVTKCYRFD